MFPQRILYLHGFRSSPQSAKAQYIARWLAQHQPHTQWHSPQLPPSPRAAMQLLADSTQHWQTGDAHTLVIGSSLGGFYATALAMQRQWRLVVLNPAIDPARDLAAYIGEQQAWHQPEQRFMFCPHYIEELQHIDQHSRQCEQALLHQHALPASLALICQGDEVLNWREMQQRYPHAQQIILPGGDHAISDFDRHWPHIVQWMQQP